MAAGDITRDSGFPRQMGNMWMMCGTIEVDTTLRAFAICATGCRILSGMVADQDGVGAARLMLNQNASAEETNGTISVDGENAGPETFYYTLYYV